ncbi:MAG: YggS family pyridoxal phosphate-dependent enzyme [Chitinophagaceae bacterium]
MAVNKEVFLSLQQELQPHGAALIAVSKLKPASDILELYDLDHRDFGENYVQELANKYQELPKDIRWHFIGHLQSNKVKYIAPFVYLIHGVDSLKLLQEIDKQGRKSNRIIDVLLQVHIAREETKFGLSEEELLDVWRSLSAAPLANTCLRGLMGMASFTEDAGKIQFEFAHLQSLFHRMQKAELAGSRVDTLSMGMSADYKLALQAASTTIRIGSMLFGPRG